MSKYVRFATDRAVVATRVLDGTGPSAVDATLLTAPLFHRRGTEALCRKTNSWGDFHAWREFLNRAKDHVLGCRPDLTGSQAQRLVKSDDCFQHYLDPGSGDRNTGSQRGFKKHCASASAHAQENEEMFLQGGGWI